MIDKKPVGWGNNELIYSLLLTLVIVGQSFCQQSAPKSTNGRTVAEASAYLKGCCGFQSGQIPNVVIVDQPLTSEFGGRYVSPGKTVDGRVYQNATIELSNRALGLDKQSFLSLVYHEALHYQIETIGLPPELSKELVDLETKIRNGFDLSSVPKEFEGDVVDFLAEKLKGYIEHTFIGEKVIEEFKDQPGAEKALLREKKYLETHEKDISEFWGTSGSLTIGGKKVTFSPAKGKTSMVDLSGEWECASSTIPNGMTNCGSGVYQIGQGMVQERSALTIVQNGTQITLTSHVRLRVESANSSAYGSYSGREDVSESRCVVNLVGNEGIVDCTTIYNTGSESGSALAGSPPQLQSYSHPSKSDTFRSQAHLKILSNNEILLSDGGNETRYRRK